MSANQTNAKDETTVNGTEDTSEPPLRRSNRGKGRAQQAIEDKVTSCLVDGIEYNQGDYIYYEEPNVDCYTIGHIEEIKLSKRERLSVVAKCFYRNRDISEMARQALMERENRGKAHTELPLELLSRELFISDVTDTFVTTALRGKCMVRYYPDLAHVMAGFQPGKDIFFYVFSYNPDTKRLASTRCEIKVGQGYQAILPDLRHPEEVRGNRTRRSMVEPHVNHEFECLLWEPDQIIDDNLQKYLQASRSIVAFYGFGGGEDDIASANNGQTIAFMGASTQKCYDFLHHSDYSVTQAFNKLVHDALPKGLPQRWSNDDMRLFNLGIRTCGKDFHRIRKEYFTSRSVPELVEFYYYWKKTSGANSALNYGRGRKAAKKNITNLIPPRQTNTPSSEQSESTSRADTEDESPSAVDSEEELTSSGANNGSSRRRPNSRSTACRNCAVNLDLPASDTLQNGTADNGGSETADPTNPAAGSTVYSGPLPYLCPECRVYRLKYGIDRALVNSTGISCEEDEAKTLTGEGAGNEAILQPIHGAKEDVKEAHGESDKEYEDTESSDSSTGRPVSKPDEDTLHNSSATSAVSLSVADPTQARCDGDDIEDGGDHAPPEKKPRLDREEPPPLLAVGGRSSDVEVKDTPGDSLGGHPDVDVEDEEEQDDGASSPPGQPAQESNIEMHKSDFGVLMRVWYRGSTNSCSRTDLLYKPNPEGKARAKEKRLAIAGDTANITQPDPPCKVDRRSPVPGVPSSTMSGGGPGGNSLSKEAPTVQSHASKRPSSSGVNPVLQPPQPQPHHEINRPPAFFPPHHPQQHAMGDLRGMFPPGGPGGFGPPGHMGPPAHDLQRHLAALMQASEYERDMLQLKRMEEHRRENEMREMQARHQAAMSGVFPHAMNPHGPPGAPGPGTMAAAIMEQQMRDRFLALAGNIDWSNVAGPTVTSLASGSHVPDMAWVAAMAAAQGGGASGGGGPSSSGGPPPQHFTHPGHLHHPGHPLHMGQHPGQQPPNPGNGPPHPSQMSVSELLHLYPQLYLSQAEALASNPGFPAYPSHPVMSPYDPQHLQHMMEQRRLPPH